VTSDYEKFKILSISPAKMMMMMINNNNNIGEQVPAKNHM
jgi:hypothetical protein